MRTLFQCVAATAALCVSTSAQSSFATTLVDFQQGTGGGVFVTDNILGGPQGGGLGGGSVHVLTLGEAGSVTLGFERTIHDGPGADFSVFENGFAFSGATVFAELAWVEVSTDGVNFARFPTRYGPPGAGGASDMGAFWGVSGGMPVVAHVVNDPDSPFDPAFSGGECFDLAELADHPLVLGGMVDLAEIHFVRLVDLPPGALDDHGVLFASGTTGGADFDAVAILNADDDPASLPICDLEIDAAGFLVWRLGHPDGFFRLDPSTLAVSANLAPFSRAKFLDFFTVQSFDGSLAVLRSKAPVLDQGLALAVGASIRDDDGELRGDQMMIQDF